MLTVEDILSLPDILNATRVGDAESLVSLLNNKSFVRVNSELTSSRAVVAKLGPADTAEALGALEAASASNPLLKGMWISVNSVGIDFSNAVTVMMIDSLVAAGAMSEGLATRLKSLGTIQESLADRTLDRDASLEDASALIVALKKRDTFDLLRARFNTTIAYLDSNPTATVAECIIKFGE